MRRIRQSLLAALAGLCVADPASAQIIPWSEPPSVSGMGVPPMSPSPRGVPPVKSAASAAPLEILVSLPAKKSTTSFWDLFTPPATLLLTSFSSTDPGSVRPGTTWVGQVTQHATTLTVAGTAQDDNGWGTTGLSLDASGYASLFITAQRDAGNAAPTLFLQFEDRTLRTKVYSLSTSLFAVGTLTTVQIPLAGWTINFGANDLTGWSIGGGSVGTVPFRFTFDEVAFSTSAIPEPSTYAALLGALSLAVAYRRRRRSEFSVKR